MTPDAAGIEAALAAGLAAHGPMSYGKTSDGRFGWFCGGPCGRLFIGDVYPTQARRLHDAHVAAALLPVVTQAQAEAWGEGYRHGRRASGLGINPYRARADESGA